MSYGSDSGPAGLTATEQTTPDRTAVVRSDGVWVSVAIIADRTGGLTHREPVA